MLSQTILLKFIFLSRLVCSSPPLGLQDRRILNHQLTASSEGLWLDLTTFKARDARLWLKSSSWVGGILDFNPWIQVSFAPEIKLVCGVATQGNPSHNWWTTSYTLKHSMTGKTWSDYNSGQGFVEVKLHAVCGLISKQCGNGAKIKVVISAALLYKCRRLESRSESKD